MISRICKVILMFALVMGVGLSLLNGEQQGAEVSGPGGANRIRVISAQTGLNNGSEHNLVVTRIGKNLNLYIDNLQAPPPHLLKI